LGIVLYTFRSRFLILTHLLTSPTFNFRAQPIRNQDLRGVASIGCMISAVSISWHLLPGRIISPNRWMRGSETVYRTEIFQAACPPQQFSPAPCQDFVPFVYMESQHSPNSSTCRQRLTQLEKAVDKCVNSWTKFRRTRKRHFNVKSLHLFRLSVEKCVCKLISTQ